MQKSKQIARLLLVQSRSRGSTLIELLIAATVTVMVMTAVAISMMYSVQREAQNRYKETATSLAQDTLDLVQTERAEQGWEPFIALYQNRNLCVDNNGISALSPPGCVTSTYGGLAFTRSIYFHLATNSSGAPAPPAPLDKLVVDVTVTWQASGTPSDYTISQTYYKGVH